MYTNYMLKVVKNLVLVYLLFQTQVPLQHYMLSIFKQRRGGHRMPFQAYRAFHRLL